MNEETNKAREQRHVATQENKERRQLRKHVHMERFVVSVDGQRKRGFSEHHSAVSEALRIKDAYPNVTVTIVDQEEEIIHPSPDKKTI